MLGDLHALILNLIQAVKIITYAIKQESKHVSITNYEFLIHFVPIPNI